MEKSKIMTLCNLEHALFHNNKFNAFTNWSFSDQYNYKLRTFTFDNNQLYSSFDDSWISRILNVYHHRLQILSIFW